MRRRAHDYHIRRLGNHDLLQSLEHPPGHLAVAAAVDPKVHSRRGICNSSKNTRDRLSSKCCPVMDQDVGDPAICRDRPRHGGRFHELRPGADNSEKSERLHG
jgi:hypothetical protein